MSTWSKQIEHAPERSTAVKNVEVLNVIFK
jgi:hypothetical protein